MLNDEIVYDSDGDIPTYPFLTGYNGKQGENSQLTILFHLYICHLLFGYQIKNRPKSRFAGG